MAEQAEIQSLEIDSCKQVFGLIDHGNTNDIPEAALAQALLQTGLLDEHAARTTAAEAAKDGRQIDGEAFYDVMSHVVSDVKAADMQAVGKKTGGITLGAALLGIVSDLKHFYTTTRVDYRMAILAGKVHDNIDNREKAVRTRAIALRQESEHQGVQEAQMMQAMEFNSAWSQNMTEFERQAREIEDQAVRRHHEEFSAFQEKLYHREPKSLKCVHSLRTRMLDRVALPAAPHALRACQCSRVAASACLHSHACYCSHAAHACFRAAARRRFSRELISLQNACQAHAKQGHYEDAHKLRRKADGLEKWETLKLQNEHKTVIAVKELQLRQQQQQQLEALKRRIQRGREEHKEHWLMGAQRLMQSHRNMLSDLKSKQALENMRADVAVRLDMSYAHPRPPLHLH